MKTIDDLARVCGFADQQDMVNMVANVDISTPQKLAAFKDWQNNDGTKAGLLKLSRNETN